MPNRFFINVFLKNLTGKVMMNDCTVFTEEVPSDRVEQYDLSCWVFEHEVNRLRVELAPLPAGTKPVGNGKSSFQIMLHKRDSPERPLDAHTMVVAFRWTADESELDPSGAPRDVFEHGWNVPEDDAFGRWSWQDAQPFDEARDRKSVDALVQRLHTGLVTRHLGMLHKLFDTRYKELSRAQGASFHELKQKSEDFYAPFFDADDWTVAPLDLDAVEYVPEAEGRLVRVFAPGGRPALQGTGGGKLCAPVVAMANLDGVWVAVR